MSQLCSDGCLVEKSDGIKLYIKVFITAILINQWGLLSVCGQDAGIKEEVKKPKNIFLS